MSGKPLGTAVGDKTLPTIDGDVEVNNDRATGSTIEPVTPVESMTDYVPFSSQNVNVALDDAYTGGGGFLGNVGQAGFYTYVVAKPTENYFLTRVSLCQYINFFAPFIDAKVDPVFALGVRDYVTKRDSDVELEDDPWLTFTKDATGTGKSLNELRMAESKHSWKDGVSFLIMDKVDDGKGERRVIEYYKKAISVDAYTVNQFNMKLETITFWENSETVVDKSGNPTGEIRFVKWRREAGSLSILKSQPISHTTSRDNPSVKFEVTEVVSTGINSLNVYPMFSEPADMGDYKPSLPRSFSVARVCSDIHNARNILSYVLFKQGHSLLVFQGKANGLRDPLSNIVEIPAGTSDNTIAMPEILSPDAELPRAHMEQIRETFEYMVAIMGNNGVSVVEKKAESGESKSYDMIGTNQTNLATVEINKSADEWRKKTFNEFEDRGDQYEYHTEYPKDFVPTANMDATELMDIARWYIEFDLMDAAIETVKLLTTTTLNSNVSREKLLEVLDSIKIEKEPSDIPPRTPATGDEDE